MKEETETIYYRWNHETKKYEPTLVRPGGPVRDPDPPRTCSCEALTARVRALELAVRAMAVQPGSPHLGASQALQHLQAERID